MNGVTRSKQRNTTINYFSQNLTINGELKIHKLKLTREQLEQLKSRVSLREDNKYHVLGYAFDLEKGVIQDQIDNNPRQTEFDAQIINVLLSHYLAGKNSPITSILIKFNKLQGGYAYEKAFSTRVTQPIVKAFGKKPTDLLKAAIMLGGTPLKYGDYSIRIPTIEGIPIVYILWAETEFPASATVLFDQSANSYLPTEDLAVLAELTTSRLIRAKNSK